MADFTIAIKPLLINEGGYSNDPRDPGGETYRGISRRAFPSWGGWKIVDQHKPLRDEQIIIDPVLDQSVDGFYRDIFWDSNNLEKIQDDPIATKLLDMAVNMGSHEAGLLAQRALKVFQDDVVVDGDIGNKTVNGINSLNPDMYIKQLRSEQIAFYNHLVLDKPDLRKFLNGWIRRANEV